MGRNRFKVNNMVKTIIAFRVIILVPSYGFSAEVLIYGNITYKPLPAGAKATAKPEVKQVTVKCGKVQKVAELTQTSYSVKVAGPGQCEITFTHSYGTRNFKIKIRDKAKRFDVEIFPMQKVTYGYDLKRKRK